MACSVGIDTMEFKITFKEPEKVSGLKGFELITESGRGFGKFEMRGINGHLSICLPRFIRDNNISPFGRKDRAFINALRQSVISQLIPYKDLIYSPAKLCSVECNITQNTAGRCTPSQAIDLLRMSHKEKNIIYEGLSPECPLKKEKQTLITWRKNYYIVKCYNKTLEQKAESYERDDALLRIEIKMQDRTIKRAIKNHTSIMEVLSLSSINKICAEYARIFNEEIMRSVNSHLEEVCRFLFNSLLETGNLQETLFRHKEIITDVELVVNAHKKWNLSREKSDTSRQMKLRIKDLGLPCDVIKTIKAFQNATGQCNTKNYICSSLENQSLPPKLY